ncbi:GH1 family beta-glucosidase [Pseudoalteromonas xiamenensis]|uniref:GH1 family beta-glucosidase n=1 Tax=Pseudoalteromonas xiamenensis TaxID=882626 RepID=UPI0027E419A3|nr:GH1 family beta-glucosidase [Pseudoalteromonas xiamenensis]WMN59993.1 GH1 family beta-glucosidase [Pseudoalteromonas xiamenensis]
MTNTTTMLQLPTNSTMRRADFTFGVATASFQIEGGAEHRLPCIWDTFCDTPNTIADSSNGLVACDHFNRWEEDVELIASLNVDAYRLSISWPRVIDKQGNINFEGVAFYTRLLQALKDRGIRTFVTLYHWDLPQHIEDRGGWVNRNTAFLYADYVEQLVPHFAGLVDSYATFNEPFCSAFLGYELGVHAPGHCSQKEGRQAAHHILLAHGLAMQVLRKLTPHTMNGIVLNFTPCYSNTDTPEDIVAAINADEYHNLWYLMPIMTGHYPNVLNQLDDSVKPNVMPNDMQLISGPIDFLGINFYTRRFYAQPSEPTKLFEELAHRPPYTDMGWEIYPESFTKLLLDLHNRFNLPPIYITENGAAMPDVIIDGEVHDDDRLAYYQSHLIALDNAIQAGVNIQGYFAWSLMDNFEWAEGYVKRFGLVYVDYETQKRTIKKSGIAYANMLDAKRLDLRK